VKGWGRWTEGWYAESEKNEWYVCRVCYGRGNHRLDIEPERRRRCSSGTWRKRSEPTGRVFVRYSEGEHTPQFEAAEALQIAAKALRTAGLEVEEADGELVVGTVEEGAEDA
jgi:hypothetical protein